MNWSGQFNGNNNNNMCHSIKYNFIFTKRLKHIFRRNLLLETIMRQPKSIFTGQPKHQQLTLAPTCSIPLDNSLEQLNSRLY